MSPGESQGNRPTGARQSSLRNLNLATVTERLFASTEPLSRADLAIQTGLTRSTVSRLVDELLAGSLVKELAPVVDGQRGRPAVPVVPTSGACVGLGLEINIRHIAARLVDLSGDVVAAAMVPGEHAGSSWEPLIASVGELGRQLLGQVPRTTRVAGIELALPGLVDAGTGVLLRAPNLNWWRVPAAEALAASLSRPVSEIGIGNEADYAALAAARVAPGRPSARANFLYLSGEVGIGSALVQGGSLAAGPHGWAGEIGHLCVDPHGARCACGATGCLETVAGKGALLAAAGVGDSACLVAALGAGDGRARAAVAAAASALGVAAAGALNLLDVSTVVLGGHLAELHEWLVEGMTAELGVRVLAAPFAPPDVVAVPPDVASAPRGAAFVALEKRVLKDPASWLDSAA